MKDSEDDLPGGYTWQWVEGAHSWKCLETERFLELNNDLKATHGSPHLVLPWMGALDLFLENREEYAGEYEEEIIDDELEDDENQEAINAVASFDFLAGLDLEDSSSVVHSGLLTVEHQESHLPPQAAYFRFFRMLEELEDEDWIVLYNECCGPCASGSLKDIRDEEPDKVNWPSFVVWEQSPENDYQANGEIKVDHYCDNIESEAPVLRKIAKKYGFQVRKKKHDNDLLTITS